MSSLASHAVLISLVCGALAVAYGVALTRWVLSRPAGNERMQEIAAAIQEGAAAYLKRQYTTIAGVAVAVFLVIGIAGTWTSDLGWKVAIGFLIGAVLSALDGLHRHERRGAVERAHGRGGQIRPCSGAARSRSRAAR